jgi:tape measure domain-containing protein
MPTTVGELNAILGMDNRQYLAKTREATAATRQMVGDITNSVGRVHAATSKMSLAMSSMIAPIAGIGLTLQFGQLAKEVVRVGSSFENMEMKLEQITGGRGKEKLAELNEWALRMPVDTEQAVQAFIRMSAYGLEPTIKNMTTLSDVAVMMGKEALPRVSLALGQMAARGKISQQELNQLSEVGINATKYLREAFGMTVDELQDAKVDINEVISVIWKGMEKDFKGGSEKATRTLTGMTELLRSEFVELGRVISNAGVMDALKSGLAGAVEGVQNFRKENEEWLKLEIPKYIDGITNSFKTLSSITTYVVKEVGTDTIEYGILGRILLGSWKPGLFLAFVDEADKKIRSLAEASGLHPSNEGIFERSLSNMKDFVLSARDAANITFDIFVKQPANFLRTLPEIMSGMRDFWSGGLTEKGTSGPSEARFKDRMPEDWQLLMPKTGKYAGFKSEFENSYAQFETGAKTYVKKIEKLTDEQKRELKKFQNEIKKAQEEFAEALMGQTKLDEALLTSGADISRMHQERQKTLDKEALGQGSEAMIADQATYEKWKKDTEDTFRFLDQLTERTAERMQDNFSDLFFDAFRGELKSLEDYASAIMTSIQRMMADLAGQMATQYLFGSATPGGKGTGALKGAGGWLSGLFGGGGGSTAGGATAAAGSSYSAAEGVINMAAQGRVFNAAGVVPFARGDVFDSGSVNFRFARGGAVAGEAGPEAVMPLKRGASGRLGVEVMSGRGATIVENHFHIGQDGNLTRQSVNQIQAATGTAVGRAVRRNG